MEETSGQIRTWEELRFPEVGQSSLELGGQQYCVCSGQLSDLGFLNSTMSFSMFVWP